VKVVTWKTVELVKPNHMHKETPESQYLRRAKQNMETFVSSPVVKSFLAGSFSGTCSTIIFQPLDLIKTRIQLQAPLALGHAPKTVIGVVTTVIQNERLIGLWKGVAPSLTRTVPGIGVYFASLHALRNRFGSHDPSPTEGLFMGAFARSISGISMLPFTVIKTRYESGRYQYRSILQAMEIIYQKEGMKGLYSGMSATLLRDAPFSGLYLMFYTQTKKHVKSFYDISPSQAPFVNFTCGIVSGCLASVVTQPADVVKTHMQLNPTQFSKFHTVIVFIYKKEGLVGFVRGVVPRTLRRTLMAAMAWTVYEQIMASCGLK